MYENSLCLGTAFFSRYILRFIIIVKTVKKFLRKYIYYTVNEKSKMCMITVCDVTMSDASTSAKELFFSVCALYGLS